MKNRLFSFILLSFFLIGCTGTKYSNTRTDYSIPDQRSTGLSRTDNIKSILYSQFREWESVKYKTGGLSKRGIDCSGFVYITYLNKLGIALPRTTEMQARAGSRVAKNNLKAGDLVFFKTRIKVRHVGIYLENGNFMHASTSKGVMISSIYDEYWSKRYWKSLRIKI